MVRGRQKIRLVKVSDGFIEYTANVSRTRDSIYVSIPKFFSNQIRPDDRVHITIKVLRQKG